MAAFSGILRHEHRRIQQRLGDRARDLRLLAHQAAAQTDDAAALVLVVAVEIGGDFLVGTVLQPEIGQRIGRQERLHLALLDRELQAGCRDRAASRRPCWDRGRAWRAGSRRSSCRDRARSPTATILPLRSASLSTPELARVSTRMQPPWVPAAILTSNPCSSGLSQRSAMPSPASRLAGRDRFQQLVGRAAVVDQFDVEIVLLEESVVDRDRQRREADRAGIPRQFQFARRARQGRRVGRCLADRELREVDIGCDALERENACAPNHTGGAAKAAAAPPRSSARDDPAMIYRRCSSVPTPSLDKASPLTQSARLGVPNSAGSR